ncbi:hypothetical protein ACFCXA_19190 [Streptomyces virginiae]|uniref:hypothetical protein n=1 Tax=Streptomyces virginiae TaxID=1961 RepID=UPI0035DDE0F5
MGDLRADVLYAAELFAQKPPQPVRVLDGRRWTSVPSGDQSGFSWQLSAFDASGSSPDADYGIACLYWSPTDPEPDGQALLDYPWEPLPEDPVEAGVELTHRARTVRSEHASVWLCLRPVPRRLLTPWVRPEQRQAWARVSARLNALGLGTVHYQGPGDQAPISLDQLTALLDHAEQGGGR